MRKLLTLAALAVIAAAAAFPFSAAAAGGAGEMLKPFCTTGTFRCMSALRVDLPVVPSATASHDGIGPADLRAAYSLASAAVNNGTGSDRRARRRVRRPDDRVGPGDVSRVLRPPAVHHGERLLQEGEPGRRAGELPADRKPELGAGDRARRRDGLRDLPELPHPARRGELGRRGGRHLEPGAAQRSRGRGRHGRQPRRNRGLEQLRHGGAGAESDLLRPLLQPSRRRDHCLVGRPGLRDGLACRVAVRDLGRGDRARQGSDDEAWLERERLGEPVPGRPPGRGGGHR